MPLLRSKVDKQTDVVTKNGSLLFTPEGIVLSHPQGSKIAIGANGIEFNCTGGVSMKLTPSEILVSNGSVSLRMTMMDCSLNANGPIRLNGSMVNVNNGALEVI
jgi:hypothetical protein